VLKNKGYYDEFLANSNPARRVGWRSELEQAVRFEIVLDLVRPDSSLLDLGCGTGALGSYLRNAGWRGRYIGVDAYPHNHIRIENSEFHEMDFTTMEPLEVDTVVAIGALVGNKCSTSLTGLLQHVFRARQSFLIIGLSREFLEATFHDAALVGFEISDLPHVPEWMLAQLQCLVSDTCVVGQRQQGIQFEEAPVWLERAKARVVWTVEELAWVCAQLGLSKEISRIRSENPQNEEIQIAFEKWQFWHEISLA